MALWKQGVGRALDPLAQGPGDQPLDMSFPAGLSLSFSESPRGLCLANLSDTGPEEVRIQPYSCF